MRPDGSFERVAVLGLGVMGGSLCRALKAATGGPTVHGWSPSAEERDAALAAGAVDAAVSEWADAVRDADLIVLATPLDAACALLPALAGVAPAAATLTDVASLKAPVARAARAALVADRWVGSHPMVGSERSGFAASRHDLYEGATIWIVGDEADEPRARAVSAWWTALRATPRATSAEEHDRRMGLVSHLPQLTANALAEVLRRAGVTAEELGPGGRDMTRLAASSPEMWIDLLKHAPPELNQALRDLGTTLEILAGVLAADDVEAVREAMERTRGWKGA